MKGKCLKKIKIFSETIRGMKLKLGIHAKGISLYINCVFILVGEDLLLLWELIVPTDLLREKWRLTISAVSLEICEFFI